MKKFRKPLLFVLCLLPIALIGGWFTAQYELSLADEAVLAEAVAQVGSEGAARALTALMIVIYAVVLGFLGYILSEKIGKMRPFRFRSAETLRVIIVSAVCGVIFSLDAWTFAKWSPELGASYEAAGSFDAATWIASILYGGVIEEVMLRLFLMSLLALIGWKMLCRGENAPPENMLIAANIITAAVFAALHLPATAAAFGHLTPMLVFRCFLLNGAFGLVFGRFYRRYGIQYAMLSHALVHIVSRTVWLIALP